MAKGDRTPTELIAPQALSTTASSKYPNPGDKYRSQMPGILLCNTGASQRTVTLFKNGTAASNQICNGIVLEAYSSLVFNFPSPLVFTGAQALYAKQDAGADVNIAAYGIVEQIG